MTSVRIALAASFIVGGVVTSFPQDTRHHQQESQAPKKETVSRADALHRAKVWKPTPIPSMNLRSGPTGPGAFAFQQTVTCTYDPKVLGGKSPKFACNLGGDDVVKVKYGVTNGEVYGEVAATRLLWALGFAADHMYPVRVICRGCPEEILGGTRKNGETLFDPAVIERKLEGAEFDPPGWSWRELDDVDEKKGGATAAQRDAFKLLAVFIQHTDTKPEQQRLICLDEPNAKVPLLCRSPWMMLNDVGLTFGEASNFNTNATSGVNLKAWESTSVWKHSYGCAGNLPQSMTGTLNDPEISDKGRRFLAGLLTQLSDRQIRDLFEISRVQRRLIEGEEVRPAGSVDEWIRVFKKKRADIVTRRCDET